ncbi:MAG: hypothetical protein IJJ13_05955 [Lachnospiraceae bacterium]|nr:hypothetical protein [Lachnospiraceae bacterium]
MKKVIKFFVCLFLLLFGLLFLIYFFNLDQKLMEFGYRFVNKVFDRKKTDLNF